MFLIRRPCKSDIRAFLAEQPNSIFSYSSVGLSQTTTSPDGYAVDHNRIQLGSGEPTWERAKLAIREWKMFEMPFVSLWFPSAPIQEGTNVAILVKHYGFYSLNAARIVYVIDELNRFGFAYGTLQDHSESGEERFAVERNETTAEVSYDLFAFSRARVLAAKLAQPLARLLQKRFAQHSLAAMVKATAIPTPPFSSSTTPPRQ